MHGVLNDEMEGNLSAETVVRDSRYSIDHSTHASRPLWLTPREAESLLVLCTASPISAGPGEQALFIKLGEFFRSYSR